MAKLTGIAPHSLDALRTRGHGPPWFIAADGLRYRRAGVEAWLEGVLRAREQRARARRRTAPADEDLDDDGEPAEAAWFRLPLEDRIAVVRRGLAMLHDAIRDQCPGDHEYVQHGDRLLPWCDACGYTDTGLHRGEIGLGHAELRSEEG